MSWPALVALLLAGVPADVPPPLPPGVTEALARAPEGTRIGLVVIDPEGREIVALRPDERFIPASNTKLFTTAAAFETLDVAVPDGAGGATVRLEGRGTPAVVLAGHGDARLSSAPDCRIDCLADLAAAVAQKVRAVGDVVGDDTAFPDERWPLGMSWNNMAGVYGTAISALTLDDNVVTLTIAPGAAGTPPQVTGDGYYRIDNSATTGPVGSPRTLSFERVPGSDLLRLTGSIAEGNLPVALSVGVDDPAHRAAWRFAQLLRAAGVKVKGRIAVRHRSLVPADDPANRGDAPLAAPSEPTVLARLTPAPLSEDLRHTNKVSQNLHAELLLRRLGSSGSVADGHAAVDALLARAKVAKGAVELADGAGMSSYNRVTPRATVALLRWAATQPWGAAWRETFPVAASDGTLARRFTGTPLAGRVWAKTGSLNATSALAGYFTAASGRTLAFAAYANDIPGGTSATSAIDAALVAIAAAH